ncbi:MAG: DUF1315 family protein [Pseudomonadales bacterium]|nr:DUF1315 family protein [Pseudomonadales bacterium]
MNYDDLIASMTPEIFKNIKRAVELGKWPNGVKLSDEQREICLQATIAYGNQNLHLDERVGYIYNTKKEVSNFDQLDAQIDDDIQVIDFK